MCRKTSLKISRAATQLLKFGFNNRIEKNGNDNSERLGNRLVNKDSNI